eukprot:2656716-Rhodomonas_salina.1
MQLQVRPDQVRTLGTGIEIKHSGGGRVRGESRGTVTPPRDQPAGSRDPPEKPRDPREELRGPREEPRGSWHVQPSQLGLASARSVPAHEIRKTETAPSQPIIVSLPAVPANHAPASGARRTRRKRTRRRGGKRTAQSLSSCEKMSHRDPGHAARCGPAARIGGAD